MPPSVVVIDATGRPHDIAAADLDFTLRSNPDWRVQSEAEGISRATSEAEAESVSGIGAGIDAYGASVARGFTGGASDLAVALVGGDSAKRYLRRLKEHRPGVSLVGEAVGSVTGAVTGAGPIGKASTLGTYLARAPQGAGAVTRIGRAALGGAVEGGIVEVGAGVSDLALSDSPVDMDRIAGELSSRFVYGGLTGGVAGGGLRGLEVGLGAAKRRLSTARAAMDEASAAGAVPEELAGLDRKALRAAEGAEDEAIEAARVPQRAKLVEDLAAFRQAGKAEKPWVAVEFGERGSAMHKASPRWAREAKKIAYDADKQIDRLLNNPKRLAEPKGYGREQMRGALQQQEHALEQIANGADELKVLHATDTTGTRAAALERVPAALERNRALQQQLADIDAKPMSPRKAAIRDAVDALGVRREASMGEKMASGAAYGMAADLVRSIPFVGPLAAPLIASRVADAVSGKLGGHLVAASRQALKRTESAVDAFMTVTRKAQPIAPVVASKVLAAARFAVGEKDDGRKRRLEESYEARAAEISSAVTTDPAGKMTVRHGARQQIAQRLAPLAVVAPHLADRLETHAVRRLAFLASKMPKATRIGMTRIPPSEMAIRAWARYVAAADDPGAIEERLADGTITPEDAEVMRELYPDRMAEITRMIVERLPTLRATLPYHRRLALSIFADQPVDAAMDPMILSVLQGQYAKEEGTEGGTEAPRPQPAFGSVTKSAPNPTPAQMRAG